MEWKLPYTVSQAFIVSSRKWLAEAKFGNLEQYQFLYAPPPPAHHTDFSVPKGLASTTED